jgi:hypothetical protein
MRDFIKVADRLRALMTDPASGDSVLDILTELEGETVCAEGFVSILCRERGKLVPGSMRNGRNIWTLTGREHLAQLMSYASYGPPLDPERNDRIRYFGFGTGSQPEVSSVTKLVTPIAYDVTNGDFLAQVSLPTYPLSPSRTSVRYSRTYTETELSVTGVPTIVLTEAGLFTDGDPSSSYAPGTRDLTLANALLQAPNAYKVFEPLTKTQNFVLEVSWDIRF